MKTTAASPKGALAMLRAAVAAHDNGGLCRTWLYLALATFQPGDRAEARQWLDKSRAWIADHRDLPRDERIEHDTLLREADAKFAKK